MGTSEIGDLCILFGIIRITLGILHTPPHRRELDSPRNVYCVTGTENEQTDDHTDGPYRTGTNPTAYKARAHLRNLDDLSREQTIPGARSSVLRIGADPLRQRIVHHAVEETTSQAENTQKATAKEWNARTSGVYQRAGRARAKQERYRGHSPPAKKQTNHKSRDVRIDCVYQVLVDE